MYHEWNQCSMFRYVIVLRCLPCYIGIEYIQHLVCRGPQIQVEVVRKIVLFLDTKRHSYVTLVNAAHECLYVDVLCG